MNNFFYPSSTQKIFGANSITRLSKLTIQYGRNVLIVYGKNSIKKNGLYSKIIDQLQNQNCKISELSDVRSNPEIKKVYEGIDIAKKNKINIILAIGGGSVWDTAKAISAGAKYNGDVWDLYNKKNIKSALPIGGIITMPATSSESNAISVISNDKFKKKKSFYSYKTIPKFVIIDPTLGYTIPNRTLKYGAFDIISHLLEGYFDNSESTFLDTISLNGIKRIFELLPQLLIDKNNYNNMSEYFYIANFAHEGILYAGRAGGDWSSHKIEHALSAFDPSIIHGQGLAIIMPAWMKYVSKSQPKKFQALFKFLYNTKNINKGIELFKKHINSFDIETSLKNSNINKDDLKDFIINDLKDYKAIGQIKILNNNDLRNIIDFMYI